MAGKKGTAPKQKIIRWPGSAKGFADAMIEKFAGGRRPLPMQERKPRMGMVKRAKTT